jgi:hypothetical protein
MLNLINESITILNSKYIYFFICNITDVELKDKRNDTLINIYCKNKLQGPYGPCKSKLNTYVKENNIYYLFNLLYGGKQSKNDTEQNRFNIFCNLIEQIISEHKDQQYIYCFDYGNLIYETEADYNTYINYLKSLNVNINLYINKKYKIINAPTDLNLNNIIFPYQTINIEKDVFKTKI